MNISTSERFPNYPKAVPISKEAWDAKVAASRKEQAAKQTWLDSKTVQFDEWRDNANWRTVDRVATLVPLVGVGATVGLWAGLQGGLWSGITAGSLCGLLAGSVCGFVATRFEPFPPGYQPVYREPLFVV